MFDYNDLLILENHVLHDANSTWCHPIVVVSLLEVTMNASSRCCQLAPKHISAVGALRCIHWCAVLLNADVVLYVHCLLRMLCNWSAMLYIGVLYIVTHLTRQNVHYNFIDAFTEPIPNPETNVTLPYAPLSYCSNFCFKGIIYQTNYSASNHIFWV